MDLGEYEEFFFILTRLHQSGKSSVAELLLQHIHKIVFFCLCRSPPPLTHILSTLLFFSLSHTYTHLNILTVLYQAGKEEFDSIEKEIERSIDDIKPKVSQLVLEKG